MDKMREDFNKWIDSLDFKQLDDLCEQSAWNAWQASRQSLVVELPKAFDAAKEDASYYEYAYLQPEVEKALDAAGVSYK